MTNQRPYLTAATLALALTLTGCAGSATHSDNGRGYLMRESAYTLKDGRTVTCLIYDHNSIDCDWEHTE